MTPRVMLAVNSSEHARQAVAPGGRERKYLGFVFLIDMAAR